MKSQLLPFEIYVTQLTHLGVFPTFERNYNGWSCVLRNSANRQVMPPDNAQCRAENMLDALTLAVDGLNKRFSDPKDLRKFIDTGVNENIDSLLENIESLHRVKTAANGNAADNANDKQNSANFLH